MSPLQVAICCRQFAIAEWLILAGADVNYVDPESRNGLRVPVLHDAVRSAVYNVRKEASQWPAGEAQRNSDAAFGVLSLILEKGGRVERLDSLGNTTILKAAAAVSEFHPRRNDLNGTQRAIPAETVADFERIFAELYAYGADPHTVDPHIGRVVSEFYRDYPVARFLVKV